MSLISRYAYHYDELGSRTGVVNTGTSFAQNALSKYGYNDRSEVTSSERYQGDNPDAPGAAVTAENRTYDYDPIGNRKASVGWNDAANAQQSLIYESNVLNQYTAVTEGGAAVASPAYDDDGNMTEYKDKTCTWNAENRLVSVEMSDKKVGFLYDYMGRRVRKQVYAGSPGSWSLESEMQFVYDGWNLVQEIAVSGSGSDKHYVWGLDISQSAQGAGGIGGLLCSVDGGSVRYYLYDGNGNVGQLVGGGGVIAAHYEYDAFGNLLHSSGDYANANPFRFSTKYWDDETDLYYYGFRYYLPGIGRWGNRDPKGENGGFNLYVNTTNNLVNGIDSLGLQSFFPYMPNDPVGYALATGQLGYTSSPNHPYGGYYHAPSPKKNIFEGYDFKELLINAVTSVLSSFNSGYDYAFTIFSTPPIPHLGGARIEMIGYLTGNINVCCDESNRLGLDFSGSVGFDLYLLYGFKTETTKRHNLPLKAGTGRGKKYIGNWSVVSSHSYN